MNVWPVMQREIRVQSRQAASYWLRWPGALAVMGMELLFWASGAAEPNSGGELFSWTHRVLFFGIWFLVPLMVASSISRERREQTLGLLFLTPLRAGDVVLAKGIVHGLRSVVMLLAAVPTLMIPFLLGGVGWREVTHSVLCSGSALLLALGAGLAASAQTRRLHVSLAVAAAYAAGVLLLFAYWVGAVEEVLLGLTGWPYYRQSTLDFGLNWLIRPELSFVLAQQSPGPGGRVDWQSVVWPPVGLALVLFTLLLAVAGMSLARLWQERAPSALRSKMHRLFCTPVVARELLRRWMRRALARNPIGWLEQRTWQSRTVSWVWLAVLISLYSAEFADTRTFGTDFSGLQILLGILFLLSVAATASGSFRRERETGVLELLLVSPLSERHIVSGRLRGIVVQFLPSLVLIIVVWLFLREAFDEGGLAWVSLGRLLGSRWDGDLIFYGVLASSFWTVAVLGLFFSLRCRQLLVSLVSALLAGLVLPYALLVFGPWRLVSGFVPVLFGVPLSEQRELVALVVCIMFQLTLALGAHWWMVRSLARRRFAFEVQ